MPWQVLFLEEFDEDRQALRGSADPKKVGEAVLEEFEDPYKAARIDKLLTSGVSTSAVDRLHSSRYPPSIRLQVLQELRATAWCFPAYKHAVVTQVFHKSSDPDYRRAVRVHDARLENYFSSFYSFVEKHRKK